METMHLSLRAALVEDRLEEFVRQAMTRGVEFSRGSEFERGMALLLVQRKQGRAQTDLPIPLPPRGSTLDAGPAR